MVLLDQIIESYIEIRTKYSVHILSV